MNKAVEHQLGLGKQIWNTPIGIQTANVIKMVSSPRWSKLFLRKVIFIFKSYGLFYMFWFMHCGWDIFALMWQYVHAFLVDDSEFWDKYKNFSPNWDHRRIEHHPLKNLKYGRGDGKKRSGNAWKNWLVSNMLPPVLAGVALCQTLWKNNFGIFLMRDENIQEWMNIHI